MNCRDCVYYGFEADDSSRFCLYAKAFIIDEEKGCNHYQSKTKGENMSQSESIAKLATALVAVQGELRGYQEKSTNPYFNSKYGDLASVWAAIREPLAKNGLSVVQTMEPTQNGSSRITVTTTLLHVSGEWIAGSLSMEPERKGPQSIGSCITYARRYSLAAIVGVSPEDDDAESATNHKVDTRQYSQQNVRSRADRQSREKPSWAVDLWNRAKNEGMETETFQAILGDVDVYTATPDEKIALVSDVERWIVDKDFNQTIEKE